MNETVIERARGHLGSAIAQSIPADDQIIMDHVKAAYELLSVVDADAIKDPRPPKPWHYPSADESKRAITRV